jgi:predicted nucleic acid-binding protein
LSDVAFVDANIVVYASGRAHAYQSSCSEILMFANQNRHHFISSAEVMQELLNVGLRRNSLEYARTAVEAVARSCELVTPVTPEDVAAALEFDYPGLSARDRIHLAVMQRIGCNQIVSTDRAFDTAPGIMRLDPLDFESWRHGFVDPVG